MNSEFFILAGIAVAACVGVASIFGLSSDVIKEKKEKMMSDFEKTCERNRNSGNKSDNVSDFIKNHEDIPKYQDYRINVQMSLLGLATIFIVCGFIEEISIASNLSTYVVGIILFIFVMITLIVRILPSLCGLIRLSK